MLKIFLTLVSLLIMPIFALAQGDGTIHDIKGKVWVNGQAADEHTPIHFGDQIITGGLSRITINLDGNVYRIASSSKLTLPAGRENISLSFIYGAFLAVFRHDVQKTIHTATTVLGVRGTGLYLSDRGKETYLCVCYGEVDLVDKADEANQGHVHATYHQVITLDNQSHKITSDQLMVGHDDEELIALETIAGRTPPETFSIQNQNLNRIEIAAEH